MAEPSTSPVSIGWRLQVFTALFLPLSVISVALRFYARQLVAANRFDYDDWIVLVALIFLIGLSAVGLGSVTYAGVGHHLVYLEHHDPEKVAVWARYLLTLATLYFVTVNIPKLAVLALYKRLFPMRWVQISVWVLAGILVCGSIANTIVSLAACEPFAANFDLKIPGAKCIDKEAFYVWTSVPNIVTDVVMLALPLPIVWKLHNTKRIKIALTFTFLVGSFGLVTSILRFHTFFVTNSFTDGTYDAVELIIWTITEPGIYLISACLLTYRPLLERLGKSRWFGSLKSSIHSSQRAAYANSRGLEDEHRSGNVPLRPMNKGSMGFTELHDEEYGGNVHIGRSSSELGKEHATEVPQRQDGITVTTKIQNSWLSS